MDPYSLADIQFGSYLFVSSTAVDRNISGLASSLKRHFHRDGHAEIQIHAVLKTNGYETDVAKAAQAIAAFGTVDAICVATAAEAEGLLELPLYRCSTKLFLGYEAMPIIVLGDMKCVSSEGLIDLPPRVKFICRSVENIANIVEANKTRAMRDELPRLENFIGVDIGMRRGDADLATAEHIARAAFEAEAEDGNWLVGGVIAHYSSAGFADIDERDRRMLEETERYDAICEKLNPYLPKNACYSLPATDGALLHGMGRHGNTVRLGKGHYGVEPPPALQRCDYQIETAACGVGVIHGIHKAVDYHGYNRIPLESPIQLARVGIMGLTHRMKGFRLRVVPQGNFLFPEDISDSEYITVFNQDQNTLYLDVSDTQTKVGDWIVIAEPNAEHANSWTKTSSRIAQTTDFPGSGLPSSIANKISNHLECPDTSANSMVHEILSEFPALNPLSGTQCMMDLSRGVSDKIWLPVDLDRLTC